MSAINPTNATLSSQVSLSVAKKTLDTAKSQGEAVVSLLQDAAQLQRQIAVDTQSPKGRVLDVTA